MNYKGIFSKKTVIIVLSLIVLFGGVIRLWQLGKVPISPDWDEVALGYNAYSIIKTGRDEYGKFLPVVLRSFDDYKPAFYTYASIPTVAIFGLNVFAVRLPSAIFGIISIILVYFLVQELFKRDDLALASSFIFAVSPWSIQFSRLAFETNTGVFFNIAMALLFLKGLRRPYLLIFSAIAAGLNIYVYQSEKVFTPLLLIALIIIYRKEFFKVSKKYIISFVVIGLIVVLPMCVYIVTNKEALLRVQGTSIFSHPNQLLSSDIPRLELDHRTKNLLGLIFDNRRIVYVKAVLAGYMSHFSLNWLFIKGDIDRHHAPNMSILYLVDLPFLFAGIYLLLFGKFDIKTKWLICMWYLIAPIPASITTEVPHAVRTENFLPAIQIFIAVGLIGSFYFFQDYARSNRLRRLAVLALYIITIGTAFLNFGYYLDQYFAQQNYYTAYDWQYGYAKAVPIVQKLKVNYKKVIVSQDQPMDKSYMFFLFYLKYPPSLYQKAGNAGGGFDYTHHFSDFYFRSIKWSKDSLMRNTLFVGPPSDFNGSAKILDKIYYPNGQVSMEIVGT